MVNKKDILFPHENIRIVQDEMINEVVSCIKAAKDMIVHAPTGIGKTVSVLAPALSFAKQNDKVVFFLTSRHTQHEIALQTLKDIKKKYGNKINVVDMIGKKWMCLQPGVEAIYSSEFTDYCKRLREEESCEFFSKIKSKGKVSVKAAETLKYLKDHGPFSSEELVEICRKAKLCPYEISTMLCKDADVIIGDYYHVFNDFIRKSIFNRAGIGLGDSIIIVDEGHNLPARIRNLYTIKLTNIIIKRALKEAKKFGYEETISNLNIVNDALLEVTSGLSFNKEEDLVRKHVFIELIDKEKDYENLVSELETIGDEIREVQKQSFVGSVANFLSMWESGEKGYARIINYNEGRSEPVYSISSICMDPSIFTSEVIEDAYSTILMSGTLTPTAMYRDLLGFSDVIEKEYPNPFPQENRMNMIIPETSTKYNRRNEGEFARIADIAAKIVNIVPGNSILFFPSYALRDKIYRYFYEKCRKTTILEKPNMSKQEKLEVMDKFSEYKKVGAVLLGVSAGSFGEGIDLPGDLLKCVVVVGLPLERPSLEIKELIEYYDEKFGKGWDYGYIFPAIIKSLQNAGRCIRTEDDKGVILFLEERFAWPNYLRCFPPDMNVKISKLWEEKVKGFFSEG